MSPTSSEAPRPQALARAAACAAEVNPSAPVLLSVRHLRLDLRPRGWWPFRRPRGRLIDDLHLDLRAGEALAVVSESDRELSALFHLMAGARLPTSGSIRYFSPAGSAPAQELTALPSGARSRLREEIRLAAPPALTGRRGRRRLVEFLGTGRSDDSAAIRTRRVGVDDALLGCRLRELDAESLRRAALARALIVPPRVLLCDGLFEGLDDGARARLAELLRGLQQEFGFALVFGSSRLGDAAAAAGRTLVLYRGRVMEQAATAELLRQPKHPYTRSLLEAQTAGAMRPRRPASHGDDAPVMGCVFHPRCALREAACVRSVPHLRKTGAEHYAACHFVGAVEATPR
ncbi:MAG: hypothetical protein QJR02_09740 [Sinobacteraceae bacterium]|nr:hypothetical protein [Nevskiaceae bacterium]